MLLSWVLTFRTPPPRQYHFQIGIFLWVWSMVGGLLLYPVDFGTQRPGGGGDWLADRGTQMGFTRRRPGGLVNSFFTYRLMDSATKADVHKQQPAGQCREPHEKKHHLVLGVLLIRAEDRRFSQIRPFSWKFKVWRAQQTARNIIVGQLQSITQKHVHTNDGRQPRSANTGFLLRDAVFCLQLEVSCLQWSFFTYS